MGGNVDRKLLLTFLHPCSRCALATRQHGFRVSGQQGVPASWKMIVGAGVIWLEAWKPLPFRRPATQHAG
jgi:hypothetical protein